MESRMIELLKIYSRLTSLEKDLEQARIAGNPTEPIYFEMKALRELLSDIMNSVR